MSPRHIQILALARAGRVVLELVSAEQVIRPRLRVPREALVPLEIGAVAPGCLTTSYETTVSFRSNFPTISF